MSQQRSKHAKQTDVRLERLKLFARMVRKPGIPAPKAFSTVKRMTRQQVKSALKRKDWD